MVLLVVFLRIIISGKLHYIRTFLSILPRHVVRAYGRRRIAFRVIRLDITDKPSCYLLSMLVAVGVIDFISYAPHDYRHMVPIAPYPACDIPLCPVDKESCIIELRLRKLPHIEGFAVN